MSKLLKRLLSIAEDGSAGRGVASEARYALTAASTAAKVSGYHVAFIAAAVMLGAGAVIMGVAVRRRDVESLDLEELAPSAVAA